MKKAEGNKAYGLALITQNRGFERVMSRLASYFGHKIRFYETCADFIRIRKTEERGVVVVDATVCSQVGLTDLQAVLDEAPAWQVIYLPATNRKAEIKEAMSMGAFGCLHKPLRELEIRQMVESAMGI